MSTISLSLPEKQIQQIDQLIDQFGFANRSEFFRSILRLLTHHPDIINQASTFPMISPKPDSVERIINDFNQTKKYSKAFLKDLEEGLKDAQYLNP